MPTESLRVPVREAGVEEVDGVVDLPATDDPSRCVLLLGHGAGAPFDSPFMTGIAESLAERGLAVMRFGYSFAERARREGRRRPPDRVSVLLAVHRAALDSARERFPGRRMLLGGKSLGARMSTFLAANGEEAAGLVLLGYPLHPPGRKEKLRSDHFPSIPIAGLFLSGTRDALCDLEHLRRELDSYGGSATLEEVPDADHGFQVPRSTGRSHAQVIQGLAASVDAWERELA